MYTGSERYQRRMRQFADEVTVYPVSCEKLAAGRSDEQWLDDVLAGGAKIVQLRDKESGDRKLLEKARYFRKRTSEAGALFLVNDRVDIAMLVDADGIHVGQNDLPAEELRRLIPDMIIGISCNSEDEARKIGESERNKTIAASYYNIGPLYQTGTKEGLVDFIGPEAIVRFSSYNSLPFTVMGGIKLQHVEALVREGARRIAVVTAINQAENMADETEKWVQRMQAALRERDNG